MWSCGYFVWNVDEADTTTRIRAFAECQTLCRVLFIGHKSRTRQSPTLGNDLVYRVQDTRYIITLGKDNFTECRTLGKDDARQRVVSGRPKMTTVNLCRGSKADTRQRGFFAECLFLALGKVLFYFFNFSNQTFYGVFLQYIDLHVQFWHNYQSVCYTF
jgi:hypothetical protein